MESVEQALLEFQKLPDWERYPMPEIIYQHFKIKKLQPATVNEATSYMPPPHESLGNGKVELRGPVEGGVREIQFAEPLPVETLVIKDDEEKKEETKHEDILTIVEEPINQTDGDKQQH